MRVLGILAPVSGAALVAQIIVNLPLTAGLGIGFGSLGGVVAWRVARLSGADRILLARVALAGALAGLAATLAYDASKAVLSTLDPSPYDPFEATRRFGVLLTPAGSAPITQYAVGGAYHLTNGISFGVAYALLFGAAGRRSPRRALATGMAWGLILETFQVALFPGWLGIAFMGEFVAISALSHLVYGAVVGLGSRRLWPDPDDATRSSVALGVGRRPR